MNDDASLLCPHCGYDVSTTLDDGLGACPECGGAIDEATCAHVGVGPGALSLIERLYGLLVALMVFGVIATVREPIIALGVFGLALATLAWGAWHSARAGGLFHGQGRRRRAYVLFSQAFGIAVYAFVFVVCFAVLLWLVI